MTADDLQAIYQKLDRHEQKLEQMMESVVAHTAACEPMQSRLEAVCLSVYGNGRDGLMTRVDRLELTRRLAGQLIAALVGLLTGAAGTAVAWLLEH
jgi:hypothetical protein